MIKHTQNAIIKGRRAGNNLKSGLTYQNHWKLVQSLGLIIKN